jgi:hypothetical protein
MNLPCFCSALISNENDDNDNGIAALLETIFSKSLKQINREAIF